MPLPTCDFQLIFESSPGLYLVLRPDLYIVGVTDAYLQATMTSRANVVGRHLFDVFPDNPDDPAATGVGNLRASLERVISTRRADLMAVQKYDIRRPESEGGEFEARYWSPLNAPVLDNDGRLAYIVHRVEDVTEFVRLKQRSREDEEVAGLLRERAGQMEAEVYLRGQELLAANQQLRQNNSVLNQLYRQIEELTSTAISWSAPAGRETIPGLDPVDSVAPEEMLARVVKLVSAHHELEEQLRQAQKMEAVGRLAGGVAHDFNNLLTVILGYSTLLRDSDSGTVLKDGIEEIEKAATRGAALTKQLLAFSRKQLLQMQVLKVNDVVFGMREMLRRLIGEHIALDIHLDPGLNFVKADRGQLEQVIMNLGVNARDAMESGGTLLIKTANTHLEAEEARGASVSAGDYIQLIVSDTGTGMDADTQARIFEPFFTTKETGRGTGLGLATVYGIVRQTGGTVGVNSAPGEGTTFTIFLPVTADHPSEAIPGKSEKRSSRGGETILVVEDEAPLRKLIGGTLERGGYKVVEAGSGAEALSIATGKRHIDLLLTDVVMPGMTGPKLVEGLRKAKSEVTVLFMSGYDRELIGPKSSEIHFLPKPFTPMELVDKVDSLVRSGKP